jgi:hypothetical protein
MTTLPAPITTEWKTKVRTINLSQPDGSTCQAACIAMAHGGKSDVLDVRHQLLHIGTPGNPATMGQVLRKHHGKKYIFDESASLIDMVAYLENGEFLITHGWFTRSGHVICLDGVRAAPDEMYRKLGQEVSFNVKDPWSEFDAPSWSYNQSNVQFYDGFYSDKLIYAACVRSSSCSNAEIIYNTYQARHHEQMAWVHRILP